MIEAMIEPMVAPAPPRLPQGNRPWDILPSSLGNTSVLTQMIPTKMVLGFQEGDRPRAALQSLGAVAMSHGYYFFQIPRR